MDPNNLHPRSGAHPAPKTPPTRLELSGGERAQKFYLQAQKRSRLALTPAAWVLIAIVTTVVVVEVAAWVLR